MSVSVTVYFIHLQANKTADQDFACPKCYYNGKQINKFVMP